MGISPALLIRENITSAVSPNQHVHFAHDEVTLIIVFGGDNQFMEIKMGLPRAHHLLLPPNKTWLAKGLPTGVTTLKDGWQGYTCSWYHWAHLTDTIFRRVLIMHSGLRQENI